MNFSIPKLKEVMLKDHFPRRHLKITVSPSGIATHKYSGKKRLIFYLSSPHNNAEPSINELINNDLRALSYVRIDDAIEKNQD